MNPGFSERKKIIKLGELDAFVNDELLPLLRKYRIFLFTGSLGAGKTTLIRKMLRALGVSDSIVSPTFTLLNVYKNSNQDVFYHFDLYRMDCVEQFFECGFNELLELPDAHFFIEWPEIIAPLIKKDVVSIDMQHIDIETRLITLRY